MLSVEREGAFGGGRWKVDIGERWLKGRSGRKLIGTEVLIRTSVTGDPSTASGYGTGQTIRSLWNGERTILSYIYQLPNYWLIGFHFSQFILILKFHGNNYNFIIKTVYHRVEPLNFEFVDWRKRVVIWFLRVFILSYFPFTSGPI